MREHFRFSNLRELLAKANEEKSGDQLAGIAASSERERVAAKRALADLPLAELLNNPSIPPEMDEVSRLILESHDSSAFGPVQRMTVGDGREGVQLRLKRSDPFGFDGAFIHETRIKIADFAGVRRGCFSGLGRVLNQG